MPVQDIPVHPIVRHERIRPGCYDRTGNAAVIYRTFSDEMVVSEFHDAICRQIGRKVGDKWHPLSECMGCQARKDNGYISQAREAIDRESELFMKADQRL